MPFTLSHPAAIIPAARMLPASALVIGSMTPDTPFYLPVSLVMRSHRWWAIGTMDVALAAVIWAVWWLLLVPPALDILPDAARCRLPARFAPFRWLRSARGVVGLYVAFALGAATHVGWDQFTHGREWGPRHIAFLNTVIGPEPLWEWLQIIGSVVGLAVIAWWLARWWRTTAPRPSVVASGQIAAGGRLAAGGEIEVSGRYPRYLWAVPVILGAGVIGGVVGIVRGAAWGSTIFVGLTRGGMAAAGVLLILALAWHVARWRERRAAARVPR